MAGVKRDAHQPEPHGLESKCRAESLKGTAYVIDGNHTVAVIPRDGHVETDRSVGFRSDLTVIRVIGRFAFGFLSPSPASRTLPEFWASTSPRPELLA